MRQRERHIEEERLRVIRVSLDVIDCLLRDMLVHQRAHGVIVIAHALRWLAGFAFKYSLIGREVRRPAGLDVVERLGARVRETPPFVKALIGWVPSLLVAEVPLTIHCRLIAG